MSGDCGGLELGKRGSETLVLGSDEPEEERIGEPRGGLFDELVLSGRGCEKMGSSTTHSPVSSILLMVLTRGAEVDDVVEVIV